MLHVVLGRQERRATAEQGGAKTKFPLLVYPPSLVAEVCSLKILMDECNVTLIVVWGGCF